MDKTVDEFKKELQSFLKMWDSLVQESSEDVKKNLENVVLDSGTGQLLWRAGFYEGKKQMLQQIAGHFELTIPSMETDTN